MTNWPQSLPPFRRGFRWAVLSFALASGAAADKAARQGQPIEFLDVVLSHYRTAKFKLGVSAEAEGPGTRIDFTDRATQSQWNLRAEKLIAFAIPKSSNEVERVEATGSVQFEGRRTLPDKTLRTLSGSGTKAIYYKTKRILRLEGPVKFSAEQPSQDKKGKVSVSGTAREALYDEDKRLLVLSGGVKAIVTTPQTPPEGSPFTGDSVTVDMSTEETEVEINSTTGRDQIEIRIKQPDRPAPAGKG